MSSLHEAYIFNQYPVEFLPGICLSIFPSDTPEYVYI